jgi:hypothetical protein
VREWSILCTRPMPAVLGLTPVGCHAVAKETAGRCCPRINHFDWLGSGSDRGQSKQAFASAAWSAPGNQRRDRERQPRRREIAGGRSADRPISTVTPPRRMRPATSRSLQSATGAASTGSEAMVPLGRRCAPRHRQHPGCRQITRLVRYTDQVVAGLLTRRCRILAVTSQPAMADSRRPRRPPRRARPND